MRKQKHPCLINIVRPKVEELLVEKERAAFNVTSYHFVEQFLITNIFKSALEPS